MPAHLVRFDIFVANLTVFYFKVQGQGVAVAVFVLQRAQIENPC